MNWILPVSPDFEAELAISPSLSGRLDNGGTRFVPGRRMGSGKDGDEKTCLISHLTKH